MLLVRLLPGALILALMAPAQAQDPEYKDLAALLAALPRATVARLDSQTALVFGALPLSCLDDLQPKPGATRPYFWQPTYRTVDDYARTRAFYGCADWSTSVSATWTVVSLLKKYPALSSGQLIREKLTDHLGRQNLDGELAYFKSAGAFQRPYGYAWLLKLYGELATWTDPDGQKYAENVAPLARFMADALPGYLIDLERPNRTAGQANSAFMLGLLLDYVDVTRDMTIKRAATETAKRLFLADNACATKSEATTPEMVSPCLAEAALMSRVLEPAQYVTWLDGFLPAAYTADFKPLRSISFDAVGSGRGRGGRGADAPAGAAPAGAAAAGPAPAAGRGAAGPPPRATWIGLAFTRADEYARVAAALPAADPRVAVFRRLAEIHAAGGLQELTHPAAFEAPGVNAFAVSYLIATGGSR
jgi:hypothetical protein